MIEVGDDIDPEEMEAAHEACQPLMADAVGDFEPPDPEELERMQEQMLEFAECMREHGVDFPDPVFSGDGHRSRSRAERRSGADGDGMMPRHRKRARPSSAATRRSRSAFAAEAP